MVSVNLKKAIATNQALTLTNVKDWLYVSTDSDDVLLQRMIISAQEEFESFTDRSIIIREHTLFVDSFCNEIILRGGEVIEIKSIEYTDVNGDVQSFDVDNVYVDFNDSRQKLNLRTNAEFPETGPQQIVIKYDAGMGNDDLEIPQSVQNVLLDIIAWRYENRGKQDMELPPELIRSLSRHRRVFF